MDSEVQRFLDSLETAADLDAAFHAVASANQAEATRVFCSYAKTLGYDFTEGDADSWLETFRNSIADSDLRFRCNRSRRRHVNGWAAFLALEREIKVEMPEDQCIGNPWLEDSSGCTDDLTSSQSNSVIRRCFINWLRSGQKT